MKPGWENSISYSAEETLHLGVKFAKYIEIGDIFALSGKLASGKTTFVKGVAMGLGFYGEVTSPTFTLINEYNTAPEIIHMDCYREQKLSRWINLGIAEYLNSNYIVFIEWPEVLINLLPDRKISIIFSHLDRDKREIKIIL